MKSLAFLNLERRTQDADGRSLYDYRYEVGDEMIVELDDQTQKATATNSHGDFRFENLKPHELSPYVSLAELFGVRLKDGHYGVGK